MIKKNDTSNIQFSKWIRGSEQRSFSVPMKLKGSIVRVERRKRIFLCEIQTIQLQTEQENPSYAESHKEWDSEQWEMLDKYQKKKGKISNAIIMSNFQN